jgi:hypothetical protein
MLSSWVLESNYNSGLGLARDEAHLLVGRRRQGPCSWVFQGAVLLSRLKFRPDVDGADYGAARLTRPASRGVGGRTKVYRLGQPGSQSLL